MYNPLARESVPLHFFGPGSIHVGESKVAVLLCYEQLLLWPMLTSAIESPDIYVGLANDYWAKGTMIPSLQRESATAWARLFGISYLAAVNL